MGRLGGLRGTGLVVSSKICLENTWMYLGFIYKD